MKRDKLHHLLDRANTFCTSMAEVETDHADEGTQRRPRRATRMTTKRKAAVDYRDKDAKKRRTFDDFFMFCNFVLEYEEKLATAESYSRAGNGVDPGMNSAGESSVSTSPTSSDSSSVGSEGSDEGDRDSGASSGTASSSEDDDSTNEKLEYTSDDDSWNLVTCFCRRPFAGRPMIECSKCQTWVHLYCAKIKKDHVPDTYFCPKCSDSSGARSRS